MRARSSTIRFTAGALASVTLLVLGSSVALAAPLTLTLEGARALATQNSPALAQSRARLDEAESDRRIARAALWPKIFGNAYANWLDSGRLSPFSAPGGAPSTFSSETWVGVRGKQVFFDGLKSWAALSAAGHGVEAEQLGTRIADADLALEVTRAFVRLEVSQRLTEVARRSLERQQSFEKLIDAQLEQGRGARLDLLKAQAQRLDAERALVAAHEGQQVSMAQLRRAIGLATHQELYVTGSLAEADGELRVDELQLESALSSNPDLQRLDSQVQQAEAGANVARGAWLPELSLQGSYGYRGHDVGGRADEWTAGVFLDWSLFEGLATHGQLAKANARLAQVREARRAAELQVSAELQDAQATWRTAVASARWAAKMVEVSREAVDAALALFNLGRVTGLEVLTSQAELTRAEASRATALGDFAVAQAQLERLKVSFRLVAP